jgi:ribonuclease HII
MQPEDASAPPAPTLPDLSRERRAPRPVCGIDEAGRGPWAGPVVAAAVILPEADIPDGLNDSKQVPRRRREALAEALRACARIGIGIASVAEIERLNILQASLLAMRRAIAALPVVPRFALVDGNRLPEGLPCPGEAVPGADRLCLSVAAASILAKTTRDAIMADLARQHPGYGWETNMGYGTAEHAAALARLGPCIHHRRGFRPIRAAEDAAAARRPALQPGHSAPAEAVA